MREIKFRGKRIDNGEWVYGSLLKLWITDLKNIDDDSNEDREFEDVKACFIVQDVHTDYEFDDEFRHQVDPDTVGQFIGKSDNNSLNIYEGDLFKIEHHWPVYAVVYSEEVSSFGLQSRGGQFKSFKRVLEESKDYPLSEKIGNIHDNPSLVGESDGN